MNKKIKSDIVQRTLEKINLGQWGADRIVNDDGSTDFPVPCLIIFVKLLVLRGAAQGPRHLTVIIVTREQSASNSSAKLSLSHTHT